VPGQLTKPTNVHATLFERGDHDDGQFRGYFDGVNRALLALAVVAVLAAPTSCRDKSSSEYVADEFADAYFRRMDQDAALRFTALGATTMLDDELASTKALRDQGYTPAQAAAAVTFVRGPAVPRDARVGYHYILTIRPDDAPATTKEADLELTKIAGAWKVVRVQLTK
jgi:hypothetical protein